MLSLPSEAVLFPQWLCISYSGLAGHCAFLSGLLLPCLHQIFFPEVLFLALLCFRYAQILARAVEKAVFGIFGGVI